MFICSSSSFFAWYAQQPMAIILPWGQYLYRQLSMGFGGSANIFQAQMMDMTMASLEYMQVYIDDLLVIARGTLDDHHLVKIEAMLTRLHNATLKVNAAKSSFCTHEIEYLGYILTRGGIKSNPKKVQAILKLNLPKHKKIIKTLPIMAQYYRDMWAKHSKMLAPLTDLVGENGKTKTTKKTKTKKNLGSGTQFINKHLTTSRLLSQRK
jgi:hypothetical protein